MNKLLKFSALLGVAGFIALIIWLGFRLEFALGICILSIILFFVDGLKAEKYAESTLFNAIAYDADAETAKKKYLNKVYNNYGTALLIIVFVVCAFAIKSVVQPTGKYPYINNTMHHTLSNKGIIYNDNLPLYSANNNSIFESDTGWLTANKNILTCNNFFTPIFVEKNNKYVLANSPYNTALKTGQHFSNGITQCSILKYSISDDAFFIKRWLGHHKYLHNFTFTISSLENGNSTLDTLSISATINKGILLENLIASTNIEQLKTNANTIQLLGAIKDIYLLPTEDGKPLQVFPTINFIDQGFKYYTNNTLINYNPVQNIVLQNKQHFFIGFYNKKKQMQIIANADGSYTLENLYPNAKYFTNKEGSRIGQIGQKFIINHYKKLLEAPTQEGFLINENINNNNFTNFEGEINYVTDAPNLALQYSITDSKLPVQQAFKKNIFSLQTDSNIKWLFAINNLADNLYSLPKQILYIGLLLLFGLATFLFNPQKGFNRLEPILLCLPIIFITVRHLLVWRIVTFPPADGIGQMELNALLNYDANFLFPHILPSGITIMMGFYILLNAYRLFSYKIPLINLFEKYTKNKFLVVHIIVLSLCFFAFKFLPIENLKRISSILIPLLSYFYCAFKTYYLEDAAYNYSFDTKIKFASSINNFFIYWAESAVFYLSFSTALFLFTTDAGFGVLFIMFLLFKNVVFSYLRKSYTGSSKSFKNLFLNPANYWLYGILFFALYLTLVGFKSSFYYINIGRWWLAGSISFIIAFACYANGLSNKIRKVLFYLCTATVVLILIPFSRHQLNNLVNEKFKHTIYRASVIFQPIDKIISATSYNTFSERKIVETAQNQWFINSYINKPYNFKEPINLRAHDNSGVDYITQTRDLILPRYVISEMGPIVVYLLIALFTLPLILYLFAFFIVDGSDNKINFISPNYLSIMALLMLFTMVVFVWLTSTNRFVFFGQDFPFLSITSKVSLILPIALIWIVLCQEQFAKPINALNFASSKRRNIVMVSLLLIVIILSGKSNLLKEDVFNLKLKGTELAVEESLNRILQTVQEGDRLWSLSNNLENPQDAKIFKQKFNKTITAVTKHKDFNLLVDSSDNYTKSILNLLTTNPYATLQSNAPIFLRYDDGAFKAEYNRNFYLELPSYDNKQTWHGSITSSTTNNNEIKLFINNVPQKNNPLYYAGNALIAILPKASLAPNDSCNILISLQNSNKNNTSNTLQIIRKGTLNKTFLNAQNFASSFCYKDYALVKSDKVLYEVLAQKTYETQFVKNAFVNGAWRMVYPQGKNLFWVNYYAQCARMAFGKSGNFNANTAISIDKDLQQNCQEYLQQKIYTKYKKRNNFKFSVIGCDGDGQIRIMADWVNNRKVLDPNNLEAIAELKRNAYFFSSKKNERDQWANTNLINLYLGPGSSIKPIISTAVVSQVNAGWENLQLLPSNLFTIKSNDTKPSINAYAGLNLGKINWQDQHGDNAPTNFNDYISKSNNFYNSLFLFLGAYSKNSFKKDSTYSLSKVLAKKATNNTYPNVKWNNETYTLPDFKSGMWPLSNPNAAHYFGNEESILGNGLAKNFNLLVNDADKSDLNIRTNRRVSFADTLIFDTLKKLGLLTNFWAFPEESYFLQKDRTHKEPVQNFLMGMMNPTAGGAPMEISPIKMVEMYTRLATQTNCIATVGKATKSQPINFADASWKNNSFDNFLKQNVFKGMQNVLVNGTGKSLFGGKSSYKGYYFYAKTGTINDGALYQSKRLALIISKNDLTKTNTNNKVYTLFFAGQEIEKADDIAYRALIDMVLASETFKIYMQ